LLNSEKVAKFVDMLINIVIGFLSFVLLSVFQTVEFYVIAAVIAAAIVAYSAKGSAGGPARQILLAGILTRAERHVSPMIELICNDDGTVVLRRYGVEGVTLSGAVSLAITVIGFDVKIKERIVEGKPDDEVVDTASFVLDFMGEERYFISYTSESAGLFVATALKNRPGNHIVKSMQ